MDLALVWWWRRLWHILVLWFSIGALPTLFYSHEDINRRESWCVWSVLLHEEYINLQGQLLLGTRILCIEKSLVLILGRRVVGIMLWSCVSYASTGSMPLYFSNSLISFAEEKWWPERGKGVDKRKRALYHTFNAFRPFLLAGKIQKAECASKKTRFIWPEFQGRSIPHHRENMGENSRNINTTSPIVTCNLVWIRSLTGLTIFHFHKVGSCGSGQSCLHVRTYACCRCWGGLVLEMMPCHF